MSRKVRPGRHFPDIGLDLLMGIGVEPPLFVRRLAGTAEPGARDIGTVAEGSDEIGVEGHQLSGPDDAIAALPEPRICPPAGSQKTGLDPFATHGDVHLVEMRPQLVLRDPGAQVLVHLRHPGLAHGDGNKHRLDLVVGLDGPGALHDFLSVGDGASPLLERPGAGGVEMVGSHREVAAGCLADDIDEFVRPQADSLLVGVAGAKVGPGAGRTDLADGLEVL